MDAVGESIIVIRIDVAVVNRCEGIATAENFFQRIFARLVGEALFDIATGDRLGVATVRFLRPVVGDAVTPGISHPRFGDGDRGVRVNEVIAVEVDHQKSGHRAVGVFWNVNEQVRLRGFLFPGEGDEYFTANGLAVECGVVVLGDLEF